MRKKLSEFFKIWDGLWSIPLAVFLFIGIGYGIVSVFGPEAGSMMPVYTQRLFYAALCLVVVNFVSLFGLFMNFRNAFRFLTKDSEWFGQLSMWQKIKLSLLIYFAYFLFFTACLILV